MYDYESEIESLESVLSHLSDVIGELQDNPYFEHLKDGYEDDKHEIQQRLDELYSMQNKQYDAEIREQNRLYEESRL